MAARAARSTRAARDNRRRMWLALAINVALLAAEVAGGILTGSLALLADAGHLLSDVGAIALALFAARLASRRAGGARRTFGYQRSRGPRRARQRPDLVAVAVLSRSRRSAGSPTRPAIEGARRARARARSASPATPPRPWCSPAGDREDLNLEAVLRHSAADALGSLGVVVAGAVVLAGGSASSTRSSSLADRRR